MKVLTALAALAVLVPDAASAAPITDVTFHGHGLVTYSVSDPSAGSFFVGPPVGTPVTVDGHIHLGTAAGDPLSGYPAAPPDGFTGEYTITQPMVEDHYSIYSWSVAPADYATSLDQADFYSGGTIDFVHGRLTDFNLTYIGDPDGHYISPGSWGVDFSFDPANWGGTWTLDRSSGAVPEPGGWALMLVGFGLTGAVMRRTPVAS